MLLLKPELLEPLRGAVRPVAGLEAADPRTIATPIQNALQQAVELEHATIPTYLYALYSLVPGKNTEIEGLVGSIVGEEMAHLALACNVLNAIGGEPVIDAPGFIPTYPGPLPGGVEGQLTVPLAPFSLDLCENVFMVIEEPEDPIQIPDPMMIEADQPLTIGQFYEAIKHAIVAAGESIFTGDPGRQLTGGYSVSEVIPVTDVASASAAIDCIVEQGEGTTTSPLDAEGDPAHYYRFAEIVHGAKLVPAPGQDPPWRYAGDPIPFDQEGVWPVPENPTPDLYPAGSAARQACDTFNYTYTSLLNVLHDTFNGQPDLLPSAIGIMESLQEQAQALMSGVNIGNVHAGPSFQYQPTNPPANS